MISRQFISKIFAFFVGLSCVYIAYEFNSKSNTVLSGSIYGTTWTISSSDYISDYHQVNINKILNSVDSVASNYKDTSEVSIINIKPLNNYFEISDELTELITTAEIVKNQSNGFYDITLGKISASKGFSPDFGLDLSDYVRLATQNMNLKPINLLSIRIFGLICLQ